MGFFPSSKHPFFVDASKNKNSPYRDWYIFQDEKPEGSWGKYWQKCETGWYYAYFAASKPDMNFRNPKVLDYYKQVVKFWLDKGVDGFRYDAVTMLVENGDGNYKHQPESFAVFRELRAFMDENYPDRDVFTVAEAEPEYTQYLGHQLSRSETAEGQYHTALPWSYHERLATDETLLLSEAMN